jgi:hypothetical protein
LSPPSLSFSGGRILGRERRGVYRARAIDVNVKDNSGHEIAVTLIQYCALKNLFENVKLTTILNFSCRQAALAAKKNPPLLHRYRCCCCCCCGMQRRRRERSSRLRRCMYSSVNYRGCGTVADKALRHRKASRARERGAAIVVLVDDGMDEDGLLVDGEDRVGWHRDPVI